MRIRDALRLPVQWHPDEDPRDVLPLDAEQVRPMSDRQRCGYRHSTAAIPCPLPLAHRSPHRFPPIRVRTRYGVTRVSCWLCDWSQTFDLEFCHPPATDLASMVRAHLLMAHLWDV
jgi:hypothetical protein